MYGALLKMDEEPAENLWERIKQQSSMDETRECLLQAACSGKQWMIPEEASGSQTRPDPCGGF